MKTRAAPGQRSLGTLLDGFQRDPRGAHPPEAQQAVELARHLLTRARELQTPPERRQQAELDRLLQNPADKATLTQITDQAFRSHSARRAVDQFIHILDVQGVPRFFGAMERTLLKGFQSFGGYLPDVMVPLVKDRMQRETANVILPAEPELLRGHLRKRQEQGVRMIVNILGEAILGEREAARRLEQYFEMLQWPEVETASIKISTLFSQITPLAREWTLDILCERLEALLRTAARFQFTAPDGAMFPKFIYLDMEEYRDMDLTLECFMATLDRPGLEQARVGLVLQAYLPDSFQAQQRLTVWARERLARGGRPITLRIVKGANMEMERVEASLRDWPQAPFKTKLETDANFKRMLLEGLRSENLEAVSLAVASHNLFEVAYALVVARSLDCLDKIHLEMLEGMANHQRRALLEYFPHMRLYAPVCRQECFIHAIGYLIRRLDENTGPDNFLRHTFKLELDSAEWRRLERAFLQSFEIMRNLTEAPRRAQDRSRPIEEAHGNAEAPLEPAFRNEPDTDFILPANGQWAASLIRDWQWKCGDQAADIPLVVGGESIWHDRPIQERMDPSRPGVRVTRFCRATEADVHRAVATARADRDGWRERSPEERFEILGRAAAGLRRARGDLMGAALAEGGKTLAESDPEVSEAVDFVEFYRAVAFEMGRVPGLRATPLGVVVVVSPWNFPIAIPCGGVAAALAVGNSVLLKPASDTVLTAWIVCRCFWEAGVPQSALQWVPCQGGAEGQHLVSHPEVGAVILTGGTGTALRMLEHKPDMPLFAETGGKNATIVTALADRDLAVKNLLQSAFSHGGQKCSATSLLLLEREVYEDPDFKEVLCDAVESLPVGSAWNLETRIGPLIRPPAGDLEIGLKTLDQGESWALRPRQVGSNPNLWSPGVKWGVQRGSFTHRTELFGPVLGVMRFDKLEEAMVIVNETGFGLTSGLESLDDREQTLWREGIAAGNLYINRPTTGAVVLRQPFGGVGKSSVGPGIKAGGPNYPYLFVRVTDGEADAQAPGAGVIHERLEPFASALLDEKDPWPGVSMRDRERLSAALVSYSCWHEKEFGRAHDHFKLLGQDNLRLYRPVAHVRVRVHADDTFFEVGARLGAARMAGCHVTVSLPADMGENRRGFLEKVERRTERWAGGIEFVEESETQLADALENHQTDRVRYASRDRVSEPVWRAAARAGICLVTAPVAGCGRVELLWYMREQSASVNYHRYGNLGARVHETRAEPR